MRRWIPGVLALALALPAGADETEAKAKEAVAKFKELYASKDEATRVAAVPALGDPAHSLTLKALAALLTSDTDKVRVVAAETLQHFGGRKDVVPVLASALAANDKHPEVEKAILGTLGKADDPAAAPVLEKYVKEIIPKRDRDLAEFADAACDALAELRYKASAESLLDLLQRNAVSGSRGKEGQDKARALVAKSCKQALKKLLGADSKGDNWREWKDWWDENGPKLDDRLNPK